jgi:hypothetical protein
VGGPFSTHEINEKYFKISVGKPEGKRELEDLGLEGRIRLKWVECRCKLDSSGSG